MLQNDQFDSKRNHFRNLESKLKPLKQRPDSAVNPVRFSGLAWNDGNMSTATIKMNDSITLNQSTTNQSTAKPKKTLEDMLIGYFQSIIDTIKDQFYSIEDKSKPIINFADLDQSKQTKEPVVTNLNNK